MSLCPHCQRELRQPDFCQGCFRSLQASPVGRFAALLEQGFASPTPGDPPTLGTDLMSVTFQPSGWKRRVMLPGLRQLALSAAALAVLAGGIGWYRHSRYLEAVRHRQNGQALTRQRDYEGARRQLQLGPDEPETHRARAQLAMAEGKWEEAAAEFRCLSERNDEVNRHLEETAQVKVRELLKQARQTNDFARALSYSDQAEQLLEQHHGSAAQMAQLHFLRAQLFQKLELHGEALQEVEQTLARDPSHAEARRLRNLLKPRPTPVVTSFFRQAAPARPARPEVEIPRLQMDPGYPTYQPPDPEFPQYSSENLSSESESRSKRSKKRSRVKADDRI